MGDFLVMLGLTLVSLFGLMRLLGRNGKAPDSLKEFKIAWDFDDERLFHAWHPSNL